MIMKDCTSRIRLTNALHPVAVNWICVVTTHSSINKAVQSLQGLYA